MQDYRYISSESATHNLTRSPYTIFRSDRARSASFASPECKARRLSSTSSNGSFCPAVPSVRSSFAPHHSHPSSCPRVLAHLSLPPPALPVSCAALPGARAALLSSTRSQRGSRSSSIRAAQARASSKSSHSAWVAIRPVATPAAARDTTYSVSSPFQCFFSIFLWFDSQSQGACLLLYNQGQFFLALPPGDRTM